MSQNQSNYLQNYQNYYQSAPEQYDGYYDDENGDLKENYGDDPPDLQVPNSRLFTEGYPEDNELYAENEDFTESQQQTENNNMQYRHEYNSALNAFYYNDPQLQYHHRTRVPKTQSPPLQSTSSFRYSLPHSVYTACPLATSRSFQGTVLNQGIVLNHATGLNQRTILSKGPALNQTTVLNQGEDCQVPKAVVNVFQRAESIPKATVISNLQGVVDNNYNAIQCYNENLENYDNFDVNQGTNYQSQENYADFDENEKKGYQDEENYEQNQKTYQTHENYDQNQRNAYQIQENYAAFDHSKRSAYKNPVNYEDYVNMSTRQRYMEQYGANRPADYKGRRYGYYGTKVMGKSGNIKKYPVTVKTPKYVTKSQVTPSFHKRPSALCLPVVTQPDPGLVKRKSKTNTLKKNYSGSDPLPQNSNDIAENYSYSAHQMHSEGDMNPKSIVRDLDCLLDQFENKMVLNQKTGNRGGREEQEKIKEISKFLKPKVPPSIKAKQEKIAKMKSSLNMSGVPLQPKMKLSLDKLLNRLQKCEISESGEKLSAKSSKTQQLDDKEKYADINNIPNRSFNYETLTRKLSPRMEGPAEDETSLLNKPSTSLSTSLDNKKSLRVLRPLDDHCAIDLHRSKSYIVDLIDRALSKELGTVPRGQTIENDMTPKRAVTTISRHRHSGHKELCYEVTAALTDSFISNATAPSKQNVTQSVSPCKSDSNEAVCISDDVDYIKQLKQLRWGHIRHIQHEARKLADLEEFLEKCGEISY